MAEKIFTVPLRRKFLKVPRYQRSKKAMRALKIFLNKNLKREVKIGRYLNEEVTRRRENPPGRVQVRIEEGEVWKAELINAPREVKKEKDDKIKIKLPFSKKKEVKVEKKEGKLEETVKEEEISKKAIEKVPVKEKRAKEFKNVEKKHAHRKSEEVITERTGQVKSRTK